jgi:hypothetical protein
VVELANRPSGHFAWFVIENVQGILNNQGGAAGTSKLKQVLDSFREKLAEDFRRRPRRTST